MSNLTTCHDHDCSVLFQLLNVTKRQVDHFMHKPLTELYYLQVYCICRMPWNPNGKAKEDMVECPECHEWYHKGCVRIPPTAYCPITGNIENYTCRPCIERGVAVL